MPLHGQWCSTGSNVPPLLQVCLHVSLWTKTKSKIFGTENMVQHKKNPWKHPRITKERDVCRFVYCCFLWVNFLFIFEVWSSSNKVHDDDEWAVHFKMYNWWAKTRKSAFSVFPIICLEHTTESQTALTSAVHLNYLPSFACSIFVQSSNLQWLDNGLHFQLLDRVSVSFLGEPHCQSLSSSKSHPYSRGRTSRDRECICYVNINKMFVYDVFLTGRWLDDT